MATIAPKPNSYFEGYNNSNKDLLGSGFTQDAVLSVNHYPPAESKANVVVMHEKMGAYRYTIVRVIDAGPNLQVVEGNTLAMFEGNAAEDFPVFFCAVADLADDGMVSNLRLYYDSGRMREATAATRGES